MYPDEAELALDVAEAVNAEIRDLFAAGADVVQIDEPWLQSRAEKARAFGAGDRPRARRRHRHDGAAHVLWLRRPRPRPDEPGYPFLAELAGRAADVSIEAAQPRLDRAVSSRSPTKTIILGVLDLADPSVETPEQVAERIRAALASMPPERLQVARIAA